MQGKNRSHSRISISMKLSYRVAQKSDYDKVLPMAEKELNSGIAYARIYEKYIRQFGEKYIRHSCI